MADEFKLCQCNGIGVGGLRCPCCNNMFGKHKAKLNRQARAKLKRKTTKEVSETINNMEHLERNDV